MISDYEDDEHFCIKCHATINGLENYITHRKSNCTTKTLADVVPKSPLPSQLLVQDEAFGLKADDFFYSLQLQSSSKKQVVPPPSTSGKTFSGILTRSKTSAVISLSTSVPTTTVESLPQSNSGKNAWIGGHQLKELGTGDNQTKLIKAVDNLSRTACLKNNEPSPSTDIGYNDNSDEESDEYDYEEDDEEDEEDVPRTYTGGKWMPEWSYPNAPPSGHTGGKWKPSKVPPQNHTKGKWKPGSPCDSTIPPPTYTKGKWKPVSAKEESSEQFSPQSHTKGKWKPSQLMTEGVKEPKTKKRLIEERKSNSGDQYWCNPCNRLLSSKIVYDRHLKSELHYKRTLHEAEFDDSVKSVISPKKTSTDIAITRKEEDKSWSQVGLSNAKDTKDAFKPCDNLTLNRKRFRRRIYSRCVVCSARVTSQIMGKHLISHYHCRKGDITHPEAKRLVLDNIHAVVLESPYQCALCKFYCNTHEEFLSHWNTPEHIATVQVSWGIITCTFCKFSCPSAENSVMYQHLISLEHEEVISVINRSVPIIIKNILPIQCTTCLQFFTLNIQLRQHCQLTNHSLSHTATDEYQRKQHCHICPKICNSVIALQRHLKTHSTKMFFCSRCNVRFSSADEAAEHRKSQGHKGQKPIALKKCSYCIQRFEKLDEFKAHLRAKHSEHSSDCPHCGRKFVISQELTVHIRSKVCSASTTTRKEEVQDKTHKCDQCMFSCDTLSEFLFHQALHGESQRVENSKQQHYKCSLCDKFFPKSSLKFHIQNHTNEKSYKCELCDARFARKNNWLYHLKKHDTKEHFRGPGPRVTSLEKNFLCATCGAKFVNNATLKKHMLVHNGKPYKCEHPGCIHMARTPADLGAHHRSTHSTEMSFRCDRCDYRGKSKQQLKRHATIHEYAKKFRCTQCSFTCRLAFHLRRHERIHTGSKPFACPHCEYRCNNLENLRKHVLSTNKHPGKCIYECKFCADDDEPFRSNFAKEFKAHLLADHGDAFGSVTEAAGYIAGIYDSIDEAPPTSTTSTTTTATTATVKDKINPTMLDERVIPAQETTFENKEHHQTQQEELFPMYIIAKDDVVYVDKEPWCMVGNFDVDEESGALVSDADPLFQEHFT